MSVAPPDVEVDETLVSQRGASDEAQTPHTEAGVIGVLVEAELRLSL